MTLKDMTANLAVKAYNDIDQGTGNFDENIKLLKESAKMVVELEKLDNPEREELELEKLKAENAKLAAEAARLLKEAEKLEHPEKDALELERLKAENAKLTVETAKLMKEADSAKADKIWDRALKIAGIVVPTTVTIGTGICGYLMFKEKMNFTTNTIKMNALLEEKGYISGLNSAKIVSSLFNEMIKK